ncbi:MAG: hypothetical protein SWH78_01915 [Thermodesulfobacteriota bacterium]|nr:hypothetical protein [Thermodesulfobacteriota bacterium]
MSDTDIRERVRKAVYDLVWQTAHLYKDAPGGKLACSQRSRLARYVDSKMMSFDYMSEKEEDELSLMGVVETFLRGLEDNFRAEVYQEEEYLSFYEERKEECLEAVSAP